MTLEKIFKIYYWIKNHWYLVFLFVFLILIFLLGKRKLSEYLLERELKACEAAMSASRDKIILGKNKAIKFVLKEHAAKLKKLRGEKRAKANELLDKPEKLARYLVRVDYDIRRRVDESRRKNMHTGKQK